jgi:hypothetical protein
VLATQAGSELVPVGGLGEEFAVNHLGMPVDSAEA